MSAPMRSNLEIWKRLQDAHYFENHPCYRGISGFAGDVAVQAIQWFRPLRNDMRLAVIGCGYGRERILKRPSPTCPSVASAILRRFFRSASTWVFSIAVMQHSTRDLVRNCFTELGRMLVRGGFVVQFLDVETSDYNA